MNHHKSNPSGLEFREYLPVLHLGRRLADFLRQSVFLHCPLHNLSGHQQH
jgi:hypothetical protein